MHISFVRASPLSSMLCRFCSAALINLWKFIEVQKDAAIGRQEADDYEPVTM